MFIPNINNLSGGFMPSQDAFLWSDKLYLEFMGKNASAFTAKRKYVLPETQLRFTSNARAFGSKRKCVFGGFQQGWKEGKLDGLSGLAGIFINCIYAGCGNKSVVLVSTPVYRKFEKPVTTRQPVKCKLV